LRQVAKRRARGFDEFTDACDPVSLELLYLAIKNAGLRWRRGIEWTAAMGQFAIQFGARFPGSSR